MDGLEQILEPAIGADHAFEADRLFRHVANAVDRVEKLVGIVDLGMPVGADRGLVRRDAANARDLVRHLGGGQDAALARFRSLTELEFDHPDLFQRHDLPQAVKVEPAPGIAHAVFGGADLENEVGTAFEMIGRESALAGIEPGAGPGAAA